MREGMEICTPNGNTIAAPTEGKCQWNYEITQVCLKAKGIACMEKTIIFY